MMKKICYLFIIALCFNCKAQDAKYDFGLKNKSIEIREDIYEDSTSLKYIYARREELFSKIKNKDSFVLIEYLDMIKSGWGYKGVVLIGDDLYTFNYEENKTIISVKSKKVYYKEKPKSLNIFILESLLEGKIDKLQEISHKNKTSGSTMILLTDNRHSDSSVYVYPYFVVLDDKNGTPRYW